MTKLRFIGLDVHADTIAVAVAEPDGDVRSLGAIPNRAESVRKLMKKLGPAESLRAWYEAGPTGYVLYWQLTGLGIRCEVVAPTLVPVKPGDRVKTDRRDATNLARCYRAGDLTAVWVPDAAHEALRSRPRPRSREEGSAARAPAVDEILPPPGPARADEDDRVVIASLGVGASSDIRATGARGDAPRLSSRSR